MAFKTYVLLPHMNPKNSNIYVRANGTQRQVLDKLPEFRPYLKTTIIDKEGKSRTLRYKVGTDSIFQDDQIKAGIDANAKPSRQEYKDLRFINSVITTNKEAAQKYLEAYPGFEGFEGHSDDVPSPQYKLLNREADVKELNTLTRQRVKAGNKIIDLDLEGTKELLYRIYGSAYKPSEILEENQNILIDYLDEGGQKETDEVMKGEVNPDENITVVVGKALTAGVISFDAVANQVARKKGDKWINVKEISSSLPVEEKQKAFADFLISDAGKKSLADIQNDLKNISKQ